MHGESTEFADGGYPDMAQLKAQQIWYDGVAAMAQADMLLAREACANMMARENMYFQAMQENARLQRENELLRAKTRGPPGLEAEATKKQSLWSKLKGKVSKGKNGQRPSVSDASTCASSNPSSWGLDSAATNSWKTDPCSGSIAATSWNVSECAQEDSQPAENADLPPGSSVMLRNLPNDYTRTALLELMNAEGFEGKYDFVYLPIDFRSGCGLGYAFINFLSLEIAHEFREHFSGYSRWTVKSDKVCQVTWSSLQGLDEHIERFRNSPVMHESVSDEQKPAMFKGSERIAFPEPTKKIREPRHWHRRR